MKSSRQLPIQELWRSLGKRPLRPKKVGRNHAYTRDLYKGTAKQQLYQTKCHEREAGGAQLVTNCSCQSVAERSETKWSDHRCQQPTEVSMAADLCQTVCSSVPITTDTTKSCLIENSKEDPWKSRMSVQLDFRVKEKSKPKVIDSKAANEQFNLRVSDERICQVLADLRQALDKVERNQKEPKVSLIQQKVGKVPPRQKYFANRLRQREIQPSRTHFRAEIEHLNSDQISLSHISRVANRNPELLAT